MSTVEIGEGWFILVPGLVQSSREESGSLVIWNAEGTFRIVLVSAGAGPDGRPPSAEEMLSGFGPLRRKESGVLVFIPEPIHEEIEGEAVFTVAARAACLGRAALVWAHYRVPERHATVVKVLETLEDRCPLLWPLDS